MGPVGSILMALGAITVFCWVALVLIVLAAAWAERGRKPPPSYGRPLVYCERCEQPTAVVFTSLTATVVACLDHSQCGFRRCIRDDLYPENVRVLHDPGPTKEGQRT